MFNVFGMEITRMVIVLLINTSECVFCSISLGQIVGCMHISLPENGRKDQVCVLGRVRLAGTCTVPALPWRV